MQSWAAWTRKDSGGKRDSHQSLHIFVFMTVISQQMAVKSLENGVLSRFIQTSCVTSRLAGQPEPRGASTALPKRPYEGELRSHARCDFPVSVSSLPSRWEKTTSSRSQAHHKGSIRG